MKELVQAKKFWPPSDSTRDIRTVMDELYAAIEAGRFDLIDDLYASYPDSYIVRGDKGVTVCLMRTPYLFRDKFVNWRAFVERVHVLLDPIEPGIAQGLR